MLLFILSSKIMLLVKCLAIFGATMLITRIAGLRTFAKMSSIDFASTIAIGSIIASTIITDTTSIATGAIALAAIVTLQVGSAKMMKNFIWFNKLFSNQPILLMRHGEILQDNLDSCGVSKEDLMAKLREANALKMENVKAVIFETTGDIAVLHGDDEDGIDDELLFGVAPIDDQH